MSSQRKAENIAQPPKITILAKNEEAHSSLKMINVQKSS